VITDIEALCKSITDMGEVVSGLLDRVEKLEKKVGTLQEYRRLKNNRINALNPTQLD